MRGSIERPTFRTSMPDIFSRSSCAMAANRQSHSKGLVNSEDNNARNNDTRRLLYPNVTSVSGTRHICDRNYQMLTDLIPSFCLPLWIPFIQVERLGMRRVTKLFDSSFHPPINNPFCSTIPGEWPGSEIEFRLEARRQLR
jgi:hypothetical protein